MALGDTGISVTAVRNESQQGNRNYISGLNTSSQVNPYSFWSPRRLQFNATTKLLEPLTDPVPYNIGDFRRYNHSAEPPFFICESGYSGSTIQFPAGPTVRVGFFYSNNETNVFQAVNLTQAPTGAKYLRIAVYDTYTGDSTCTLDPAPENNFNPYGICSAPEVGSYTLSNQRGVTGAVGGTVLNNYAYFDRSSLISATTTVRGINISPALTGHSVDETIVHPPNSGLLLIDINTTGISVTTKILYAEMVFVDAGYNVIGKVQRNVTKFRVKQIQGPSLELLTDLDSPVLTTTNQNLRFDAINAYENNTSGSTLNAPEVIFQYKVLGTKYGNTPPTQYAGGTLNMSYYDPVLGQWKSIGSPGSDAWANLYVGSPGNWTAISGQNLGFLKATTNSYSMSCRYVFPTYASPDTITWKNESFHSFRFTFLNAAF